MHKLAKGLKKKKKGKKSKHKEEELFKPEELEAYRREHASASEETAAKNEEWRNFLSLTSGVDNILKKTQDDLDRIKSTSFFQRIPPASETEKRKSQEEQAQNESQPQTEDTLSVSKEHTELGIVQVSESESEEEDDIFDTTYIDAIAAGEVKLAYIPESPTDKVEGDDPFDTSIAERAILGPAVEKKGKKLVPLGAAVEVLTGRVQLPTCATKPVSRRQILKERDLLLGSFDTAEEPLARTTEASASPEKVKTLLDDDEIPLPDEPIDLSKSLYIPPPQSTHQDQTQDNIPKNPLTQEDEDDKEFEALAAESLAKNPNSVAPSAAIPTPLSPVVVENPGDWKPFGEDEAAESESEIETVDPFDTTFTDKILPGKQELKLIEKDILENDIDFDPRAAEKVTGEKKFVEIKETVLAKSELNLITPVYRDLLGGSTSDLSKLGDKPIQPTEEPNFDDIKYCDPFDTSIVDSVKAPGQAELKYLEKELLSDIKPSPPSAFPKVSKSVSVEDNDFNPRALEAKTGKPRASSRPDVLNVGQSKTVSFSVPQRDLLGAEEASKVSKPLTPFYVREDSLPRNESPDSTVDPFDTSFVPNLAPGKAELKIIESELFNLNSEPTFSLDDPDFDPRDESKVAKVAALEAIKEIAASKSKLTKPIQPEPIDLLSVSNDISAKVLTPAAEDTNTFFGDSLSYADPFDTTIAKNILPGKAELKILENELIQPARDLDLEQKSDLLVHSGDTIIEKPLSPKLGRSLDIESDDLDPFDTSFASNIQPGRAELKVLESELI